jgi:sensor c-di-GMP phosphodiesterase-like protein
MQLQALKHSIDISDLTCWYQPIYDVKNNILLGYEALMRSENQNALILWKFFEKHNYSENTLYWIGI